MARVFNIGFNHQGKTYSALVSVKNEENDKGVDVRVYDEYIQINLPHGDLRLMISDLVRCILDNKNKDNMVLNVTDHISLHLLNPTW